MGEKGGTWGKEIYMGNGMGSEMWEGIDTFKEI
jgi:hypothetical protein